MIGTGNSSFCTNGNALDAKANPANLSSIENISFFATPYKFELTELSSYELSYNRNIRFIDFGTRFSIYGFDLYKEFTFGLTIARYITNSLKAGININYHRVIIKNYGSDGSVSLDLGLNYFLNNYLSFGFSWINFNNASIGGDNLDQEVNFGISIYPLEHLTLFSRIEKNILFKPNLNFGLELLIDDMFSFRGGTNSNPEMIFTGLGVKYSKTSFDYAVSYHNILGLSHSFSLSWDFEK